MFFFFIFNPLNASVALIVTSQLICTADQLTGFYITATLAFNRLIFEFQLIIPLDTGRKLNVHKVFRKLRGHSLNLFIYLEFTFCAQDSIWPFHCSPSRIH